MKLSKNSQVFIVVASIIVVVVGLRVFSSKPEKVSNTDNLSPVAKENAQAEVIPSTPTVESENGQVQSINVPTPAVAYMSNDDSFVVNFPTAPKVTHTMYKSKSTGAIPLTEYTQDYTSGGERAWYKVAVYHFPDNYMFADNFLDESADVYVGSVSAMHPGTKITSHQKTQFLGNPAITGTVTVPVRLGLRSAHTTDTNDYVLMTVKGQNLYIISTYGTTQDNFNSFINSFQFQ